MTEDTSPYRQHPFETGPQSPLWVRTTPSRIDAPQGNIAEAISRSAARHPEQTAMHYYGTSHTYRKLAADVDRLAGFLVSKGLKPGDRVLLDMQNSPQYVISFYAILRANGVVVPINPMNTAEEIDYFLEDSGARLAIVGSELVTRFSSVIGSRLDHIVSAHYADMAVPDDELPFPAVMNEARYPSTADVTDLAEALSLRMSAPPLSRGDDDLAILPYSSGTTGRPKACMHSHAAAQFVAEAQAIWYGLDHSSVMTSFMPFFHVAGMMASMASGVSVGATLIIKTRWDPNLISILFKRYRPTWWSAAPTMVVDVLGSESFSDDCFESLKVLTGGGSSMPAPIAQRLEDRWGLRFCEAYGLTETISATHINSIKHPKAQCLGIPISNTHSIVVNPDSLEVVETSELGEILISGPQVMSGYWQRPEATEETLIELNGRTWLRTGDLGYVDAEGAFYLVDRIKRMINMSGYKVWPAECEMLLYRHPAVMECAVVSAPDPRRGECVRAIIALHPQFRGMVTEDDIITFARGLMAAYKIPRQVDFRDQLPRSGTRKIDWRTLQTQVWAEAQTDSTHELGKDMG
ncbi:AMP-binding protein [Ochrobactrum sp. XJ1]|nr:AMP-binding protein [Ochrobactrum sp. XJ1]